MELIYNANNIRVSDGKSCVFLGLVLAFGGWTGVISGDSVNQLANQFQKIYVMHTGAQRRLRVRGMNERDGWFFK